MDTQNTTIEVTMLPTESIRPNAYNPNRMSDTAFARYVDEVRRLGRLPKPIVVRKIDDTYEIVDGEHAWRAAKKLKMAEAPCEIVEVDDFTAMLETFKRNQHGSHCPLREGEMFQAMIKESGLSIRKLATRIKVSEATIRNRIAYCTALKLHIQAISEVRTPCAVEDARERIAKLSLPQINAYFDMPEAFHDKWLLAGACLANLRTLWFDDNDSMTDSMDKLRAVDRVGLVDLVTPGLNLYTSLKYVVSLAEWLSEHHRFTGALPYVRAVGERQLPVKVLDHLPCKAGKKSVEPWLDLDAWSKVLDQIKPRAANDSVAVTLVQDAVPIALTAAGVDLSDAVGPDVAASLQRLEAAPAFLRDADWLQLRERIELFELCTDAVSQRAVELAVAQLRKRRDKSDQSEGIATDRFARTARDLFLDNLSRLHQEERTAEEARILGDNDQLLNAVARHLLGRHEALSPDGAATVELLGQRLAAIPHPERVLLGSLVLRADGNVSFERWRNAVAAAQEPVEACS